MKLQTFEHELSRLQSCIDMLEGTISTDAHKLSQDFVGFLKQEYSYGTLKQWSYSDIKQTKFSVHYGWAPAIINHIAGLLVCEHLLLDRGYSRVNLLTQEMSHQLGGVDIVWGDRSRARESGIVKAIDNIGGVIAISNWFNNNTRADELFLIELQNRTIYTCNYQNAQTQLKNKKKVTEESLLKYANTHDCSAI